MLMRCQNLAPFIILANYGNSKHFFVVVCRFFFHLSCHCRSLVMQCIRCVYLSVLHSWSKWALNKWTQKRDLICTRQIIWKFMAGCIHNYWNHWDIWLSTFCIPPVAATMISNCKLPTISKTKTMLHHYELRLNTRLCLMVIIPF